MGGYEKGRSGTQATQLPLLQEGARTRVGCSSGLRYAAIAHKPHPGPSQKRNRSQWKQGVEVGAAG
eukprot:SAG31_NODE_179_length_21090_cov_11.862871_10_plen_66_part_00